MEVFSKTEISGFTIVRNASILGYPLRESIKSVLPLVKEFIINVGKSDDDTLDICKQLQRESTTPIHIVETEWTRTEQSGGYQLKMQTDLALKMCKLPWCFYIQADEVIHEEDYFLIAQALKRAESLPHVMGILFQYLHFYGSYQYEIKGRNWYRREVRIIRNHQGIQSFRDAQGFRLANGDKVSALQCPARVFHYGYVRDSSSLKTKSEAMATWWGSKVPDSKDAFQLRNHVGLSRFKNSHPSVMTERIKTNTFSFIPKDCPRIWTRDEIKNLITLWWESIIPYRIGEYRNYEPVNP